MLTGDKRETAHDIAKTTCLIDNQTIKHEFFPDDSSEVSVADMTSAFHRKLSAALGDARTKRQQQQQQQEYSVLIGSECVRVWSARRTFSNMCVRSSRYMSILLGPDAAAGSNSPSSGGQDAVMSPSEKRRMSNPALGGQPGVIDVEVLERPGQVVEATGGSQHALQRDFVELCDGSCSVICCRMSPSQKGRMVLLMRRVHPNLCTLAIGDGANDVNMIQSANIGIGVRGKEGMQAVLASDYAITRFRFLLPLLLVHGHWNYRRQSKTILCGFWGPLCFAAAF